MLFRQERRSGPFVADAARDDAGERARARRVRIGTSSPKELYGLFPLVVLMKFSTDRFSPQGLPLVGLQVV